MATWRPFLTVLLLLACIASAAMGATPAGAQEQGRVPGESLGNTSDPDFWRAVRQGNPGTVSAPNPAAGVLIQSEGDNWRAVRNGPLSTYGVWGLIGIIALLALFFAIRGRIRIEHGRSGRTVTRFNFVERFTHWLTASCFVILALTGLNILYGRYVLRPLIGPEAFSWLTMAGKYAHNFVSFGFMLGLALMFVLWVVHNLPNRYDLIWLAKGGGIKRGVYPPAKRFNAGQKITFWLVILGGISVSLSGIMLLFPFQLHMFGPTFEIVDRLFNWQLPSDLTPLQEMQLGQLWHAIVGLLMMILIIAHIYIGTIGMEGAFDAMGSGEVDRNWAREHHNLWVEELERRGRLAPGDD